MRFQLPFNLFLKTGCILFLFLAPTQSKAQVRYLQEVFPEVTIQKDVLYGVNASILFKSVLGEAIPDSLRVDVYSPSGDLELTRPLIIYLHDGNFLPFISPINSSEVGFNGMCGGERSDSNVVLLCTRLARMGYVVATIDYRLGWNPLAASKFERANYLVNAIYRGVQDVRTAARFFRRSAEEENNPFGIDTTRIVIWGEGTGAMISLNANMLDSQEKIMTGTNNKFMWDHDNDPATPVISMVTPDANGDIYGTSTGIDVDGDTLCYPNHVGYSSGFQLGVNLGGACLDSAWIEPGQVPLISLATASDKLFPYGDEIVWSIPHFEVIGMHGSYAIQRKVEKFGNQDVMLNYQLPFDLDEEKENAYAGSPSAYQSPLVGLYPLNTKEVQPNFQDIAPWKWTSEAVASQMSLNNCNIDKAAAIAYLDTILRFYAPRACLVLQLQPCTDSLSQVMSPPPSKFALQLVPNPATDQFEVRVPADQQISGVDIHDSMGRRIFSVDDIQSSSYTVHCSNWFSGIYRVTIRLSSGILVSRTIIH